VKGLSALQKKRGRPQDAALRLRRQEEILDAAAVIFARHGYAGTDVQFVADALGISKGTIYRYFPSKESLFLATADRGMQRLHLAVEASREGLDDPLDWLQGAIHAYLTFFRNNPEYVELLIQERAVFKDRKKPTYFEHREAQAGKRRAIIQDLMAQGRLRHVPVDRILDVIGDLIYGTMFTSYFTGSKAPLESKVQDLVDILFNGILPRSSGEWEVRGG
jgi:AcrR family transcriptional regulator